VRFDRRSGVEWSGGSVVTPCWSTNDRRRTANTQCHLMRRDLRCDHVTLWPTRADFRNTAIYARFPSGNKWRHRYPCCSLTELKLEYSLCILSRNEMLSTLGNDSFGWNKQLMLQIHSNLPRTNEWNFVGKINKSTTIKKLCWRPSSCAVKTN